MRCAKFGQGTNSYFIWMPVLAVKSFDSSTSALAGSQAAQHSVSYFCCACAPPLISAAAANAVAATALLLKLILGLLVDMNCGHSPRVGMGDRKLDRKS